MENGKADCGYCTLGAGENSPGGPERGQGNDRMEYRIDCRCDTKIFFVTQRFTLPRRYCTILMMRGKGRL